MKRPPASVLSAAILLSSALCASAQGTEPGLTSAAPPLASGQSPIWGTGSTNLQIGMSEFEARNGASNWTYASVGYVTRAAGSDLLWATLRLPNGAFIEGIDAFFNDNSATSSGRVFLTRFFGTNSFEDIASGTTAGNPGFTTLTIDINRTVDNTNLYVVYLDLPIDAALSSKGVRVRYHLQVSPAPATATFPIDVPTTHPFFRFVEALAASGLTGGCGTGQFCPDQPVTRGQMAVFLSTALGLNWSN
jgi:hypothetical protein